MFAVAVSFSLALSGPPPAVFFSRGLAPAAVAAPAAWLTPVPDPRFTPQPPGGVVIKDEQHVGIAVPKCDDCPPLEPGEDPRDDSCRWLTDSFVYQITRTAGNCVTHIETFDPKQPPFAP